MAYNMTILGLSCLIGAVLGFVLVSNDMSINSFGICAVVTALVTIAAAFTDRELETNKYGQVKDACLEAYLEEQRALHPDTEPQHPSCCVQIGHKLQTLC